MAAFEYVVVTRARMRRSKRFITHTYGPHSQSVAKAIKKSLLKDAKPEDDLTVSVCRLLKDLRPR